MSVRRLLLPLAAVEELARRSGGLRLPWPSAPPVDDDPLVSLRAAGMLRAGHVVPEARALLELLCGARIQVEIDLALTAPASPPGARHLRARHLRAWHRLHHQAFATATTEATRGLVELAWGPPRLWADEVVRIARLPVLPDGPTPPLGCVDVPWPVLLAPGQARDDHDRLLHESCLGRLSARAARVEPSGDRRLGLVSWLLYADGWRALTPYHRDGRRVRLDPVPASALAGRLRALLAGTPA